MNQMFAAITDTAGNHLAYARVDIQQDGAVFLAPVVATSPQSLFAYYFNQGGRRVLLDLWEITLEGILWTRMDGTRRQWWVAAKPAARTACAGAPGHLPAALFEDGPGYPAATA